MVSSSRFDLEAEKSVLDITAASVKAFVNRSTQLWQP
jgi:hypothetical protein